MDVNLAAAVQLGSIVDHHWKFQTEEQARKISVEGFDFIIFAEADKALVRANLAQSLYIAAGNTKIIKQYVRCVTTIARHDYPEQWPDLLA